MFLLSLRAVQITTADRRQEDSSRAARINRELPLVVTPSALIFFTLKWLEQPAQG